MFSSPRSDEANCSPSRLMLAVSSRMRSTMSTSSLPGSVRPSSRLPRRTNSSTPSSSSRSLMCLDTPDCEVKSALATSVRLKLRRTVSRMMRSCWKFIVSCSSSGAGDGRVGGEQLKARRDQSHLLAGAEIQVLEFVRRQLHFEELRLRGAVDAVRRQQFHARDRAHLQQAADR